MQAEEVAALVDVTMHQHGKDVQRARKEEIKDRRRREEEALCMEAEAAERRVAEAEAEEEAMCSEAEAADRHTPADPLLLESLQMVEYLYPSPVMCMPDDCVTVRSVKHRVA